MKNIEPRVPELPSTTGRPRRLGPAQRVALADIVKRIDASEQSIPTLKELCDCARVSPRMLRMLFQQAFGKTPTQYLRSRRLRLVRAVLASATAENTHVASVARAFGFRDLGRMAADYRALFGEYPSQTLRRDVHAIGQDAIR